MLKNITIIGMYMKETKIDTNNEKAAKDREMEDANGPVTCGEYDIARKPLFYVLRLNKDEHVRHDSIGSAVLVFVLEGTLRVSIGIYIKDMVEHGCFFVVHKGDNILIRCMEDAVVLFCCFDSSMAICNGFAPVTEANPEPPTLQQRMERGLPQLPIHKLLCAELKITQMEMESGLMGMRFMEFKRYVIVMLLRSLYNKEDLFFVFRSVQGDDYEFREQIFQHYNRCVNVQELSSLMQMPPATFNRKFRKAFGLSAIDWLNAKRKVNVLMDLKTTDLTIKEIAEKYHLTPNYLTSFCKKHLGDIPARLRSGED